MTRPALRGIILAIVLVGFVSPASAAPKRPSNSSSACSVSSDKFDELARKNPSAAAACRGMSDAAAASGRAFAFMCDAASGKISCCDESSCVELSLVARPSTGIPASKAAPLPGQGAVRP